MIEELGDTSGEGEDILEFDRDDFIRGMESAGLQLADRQGAPLKEIQENIRWAQSLPEDAIVTYNKKTGSLSRILGTTRVETAKK